jgi:DNA modification methylase
MNGYGLVHGDALRLPLADESVDLIVTSPPYFALRSYQDDGAHYAGQLGSEPNAMAFLAALWAVSDECWRVLKPPGSMFVDLGDKYAGSGGHNNAGVGGEGRGPGRYTQAADVPPKSLMGLPWRYALGLTNPDDYRTLQADDYGDHPIWTLRAEIVWAKPNGLPESVTDRVRRSHETWFHLTKQGRYYAAVDELRTPHVRDWSTGAAGGHTYEAMKAPGEKDANLAQSASHVLGALPGSVWTIPSEPLAVPAHLGVDHFAAFPQEWPRRFILGWSPPGICTKCGEGRVPVISSAAVKSPVHGDGSIVGNRNGGPDERRWDGLPRFNREATITGYRCACDVTLAPTRPAVVLDPFVGTGTVPMVARALGRYGIGVDLSRDYLRLARWRITRSGHGSKSEARTNRERQGALW